MISEGQIPQPEMQTYHTYFVLSFPCIPILVTPFLKNPFPLPENKGPTQLPKSSLIEIVSNLPAYLQPWLT